VIVMFRTSLDARLAFRPAAAVACVNYDGADS
jgi:hypothetical protein